jgi:hypothetical protein
MAVLTALLATALLIGLGLSIALIGTTEATLAADDRTARALSEASLAGAYLATADLRTKPSWSAVLAPGPLGEVSGSLGRAVDASLTPAAPWGGPALDLRAATAAVQAAADTGGGDPQVWRLFEYGSLAQLVPAVSAGPWYLAVWVADDQVDGDGDPLTDTNGILAVRAVAFGPREARVTTAVSIRKTVVAGEPDRIRVLTIRPAP